MRLRAEIEISADDAAAGVLLDAWQEINRRAMETTASTLDDAIACLEYARSEHVQCNMDEDEEEYDFDPRQRLILHLLDGALGVLRRQMHGR